MLKGLPADDPHVTAWHQLRSGQRLQPATSGVSRTGTVTATFTVANTGSRAGTDVVQIFHNPPGTLPERLHERRGNAGFAELGAHSPRSFSMHQAGEPPQPYPVAAVMPGRPGLSFHADAEPVLQLIERGEPALLEGEVPQLAEHLPRRLAFLAKQARSPRQYICFLLLAHRQLPSATICAPPGWPFPARAPRCAVRGSRSAGLVPRPPGQGAPGGAG